MNDIPEVIVAEISRNYFSASNPADSNAPSIGAQFEAVIRTNRERGYHLDDYKFNTAVVPDAHGAAVITETIIATFYKES